MPDRPDYRRLAPGDLHVHYHEGQTLRHVHEHDAPHGYYEHPDDPRPDPSSPAARAQAIIDDLTAKEAETLRVVLTAALSVSRTVIGALPPDLRAKLLSEALAAAGEQPVMQLAEDCLAAEAAVDRIRALHPKETDVIGFERPASAGPGEVAACRYCDAWWPCETIAALDGP